MLTVPVPGLTQQEVAGTRFMADQPIELECGPIHFPNGEQLDIARMVRAAYWVQRHVAAGRTEIWNEATRQWDAAAPPPQPQPMFFTDNMWKALVVPIGQKDHAGLDKFATASGFPTYSVKCTFTGRDTEGEEHDGVSPDSVAVEIRPPGEEHRASLFMRPKDDPAAATAIGLVLRDASLTANRGTIIIAEQGGGATIDLLCAGAQIQIRRNGEILLRPKSGESVRIAGDVVVEGTVTAEEHLVSSEES